MSFAHYFRFPCKNINDGREILCNRCSSLSCGPDGCMVSDRKWPTICVLYNNTRRIGAVGVFKCHNFNCWPYEFSRTNELLAFTQFHGRIAAKYLSADGSTADEPRKLLQSLLANREHFAAVFSAANAIILVFPHDSYDCHGNCKGVTRQNNDRLVFMGCAWRERLVRSGCLPLCLTWFYYLWCQGTSRTVTEDGTLLLLWRNHGTSFLAVLWGYEFGK